MSPSIATPTPSHPKSMATMTHNPMHLPSPSLDLAFPTPAASCGPSRATSSDRDADRSRPLVSRPPAPRCNGGRSAIDKREPIGYGGGVDAAGLGARWGARNTRGNGAVGLGGIKGGVPLFLSWKGIDGFLHFGGWMNALSGRKGGLHRCQYGSWLLWMSGRL